MREFPRFNAVSPVTDQVISRKHQKYHIKYFYCLAPDCEKAFATQKDLTRHARTHRKGEGYRCYVEGCRKAANGHIYSRKDNFDRHMRTAHPTHPNV